LRVRLGINLGPVKLLKDINGALNAIGDGINAGQRVMSFAPANQILVSQSFFEVVSRLSDDYKPLFHLKGIERDKHIREHTVYFLVPPGSEKREPVVLHIEGKAAPSMPTRAPGPGRSTLWVFGGGALVVLAAGMGFWHFYGSAVQPVWNVNATPVRQDPTRAQSRVPEAEAPAPTPSPLPVVPAKKAPKASSTNEPPTIKAETTPAASARTENAPPVPPPAQPGTVAAPPSTGAKSAFDEAKGLMEENRPAEAVRRFDDAIRASPDYVDAYIGRAEARRRLIQYELSLEDCNKVIRIKPEEPRGYNCRGDGYRLLEQFDPALRDFTEALRLNPSFSLAYFNRGNAYNSLQQYDRAVQDFTRAIHLQPRDALFYIRRGNAFSSLKQYEMAIHDYAEAIRLKPRDIGVYRLRAAAEESVGDAAGAAADRQHAQESRKKKRE
jgi:Tfp pilus assembly protein PilF